MLTLSLYTAASLLAAAGADSALISRQDSTKPKPPQTSITTTGEIRIRSEGVRPISGAKTDQFTLMRSRLGARINASKNVSLFLEAQDSRIFGDGSSSARQTFDLHQGYIQLSPTSNQKALSLRAGRQEIALANERLVGAVAWSNTGRTFDGARVSLSPKAISGAQAGGAAPRWSLDAFSTVIEERGARYGTDKTNPRNDQSLSGAFFTAALDKKGNARVDMTALVDAEANFRSYRDARRQTIDLRIRHANVGGLRFELEGAIQGGSQVAVSGTTRRSQDVQAWLAGIRLGNAGTAQTPFTVTVGADLLSGDKSAGDGTYSAFNTLYATNHPFYGLMDLFGDPAAATRDRGLHDIFAHGDIRVSDRTKVHTELHQFNLATGSNTNLGWEADIGIPFVLDQQTRFDLGYSVFRAGNGAAAVGLGNEGKMQHWIYIQLRSSFSR